MIHLGRMRANMGTAGTIKVFLGVAVIALLLWIGRQAAWRFGVLPLALLGALLPAALRPLLIWRPHLTLLALQGYRLSFWAVFLLVQFGGWRPPFWFLILILPGCLFYLFSVIVFYSHPQLLVVAGEEATLRSEGAVPSEPAWDGEESPDWDDDPPDTRTAPQRA